MSEKKQVVDFFNEKKDVEILKQKVADSNKLTEQQKSEILSQIDAGKYFDFNTGFATIDKPWQKFFKMDEFYKIRNSMTIYEDIVTRNQENLNSLALMYFGAKIKYRELFANINKTAKSLAAYGVKKGDFVTVCCAGIPETVYTVYALAKIGAVANLMAPYFDLEQMADRINDCDSKLLIVMDSFYDKIRSAIEKSSIQQIVVVPTLNSSPLRLIAGKSKLNLNPNNEMFWNAFIKNGTKQDIPKTFKYEKNYPLCMVYSSGTTGASKAIVLSHDSFQYSVLSYDASTVRIVKGEKMYQIIPPWYSTGLNTSIHLPLHSGVTVLQDPRFEREIFVRNIVKYNVSYAVAPTSMYEGFLDENLIKGKKLKDFNNPFEGGEPLTNEVKGKIEANFKKMGCETTLRVGYGQCECGATATSQSQMLNHPEGSVGIPIPGVNIAIFNDAFEEQPYGTRGNILINTPCGMMGYYKNPSATDKYFYFDKYGVRWNCTGDIGYMDENGDLFIEGRKEDFTLINGNKIYNFDIENAVKSQPDIKICDCIGRPNESGGKDLGLHIVFIDEHKNFDNESQLIERLKQLQKIAFDRYNNIDYVPKFFKIRDSFPYKPSGKRDIEALGLETEGFIFIDYSGE